MSNDYYFRKWRYVLEKLKQTIEMDLQYQETKDKFPDKRLCALVKKISGILTRYTEVYNDAVCCLELNLQVQKTAYIANIVGAVSQRIIELKHQLTKLEQSNYHFMAQGLASMKLTTDDVQFRDIPSKAVRPAPVQAAIDGVWGKAKEIMTQIEEEEAQRKEELENLTLYEVGLNNADNWWLHDKLNESAQSYVEEEQVEEQDPEDIEKRRMVNLIKAQERCRKVTEQVIQAKQKRETWTKMLDGSAKPQARLEVQMRAASLIQKIARTYFALKRKKAIDCRREELLGIRLCKIPSYEKQIKAEEIAEKRILMKKSYEEEWTSLYEKLKQKCRAKSKEIQEDYRDEIRSWFERWYKEAWFFYDIPKARVGGSVLILKDEVPSPLEWQDLNKAFITESKQKKNAVEARFNKKSAKIEAKLLQRIEAQKEKEEKKMLQKMLSNPKSHPGFKYPLSNKMDILLEAVKNYHVKWDDLDKNATADVKAKFVITEDIDQAWADVKLEVRPAVDGDMRKELELLKKSLRKEYETFEEEWPKVVMPQNFPRMPKIKKTNTEISNKVVEQMVDLALKGFLKEYPKTRFEDFKGETNFAGDDLRCNYRYAIPYGGETRNLWWERCRDFIRGFRKILLVGPKSSGKTLLAYIMATVNNAVLFEIEISSKNFVSSTQKEFNELSKAILTCAKAAQPALIYIKHVHRVFYKKVPPEEPYINRKLVVKYLLRRLTNKFHKNDKVTIIASCQDPWLTKSKALVKLFPNVVMMPNTTYTTTVMILKDWVFKNRMVPADLNVSCLARMLQGYSFGYLQNALQSFLSAERIVRMAGRGLSPDEIVEFICNENIEKPVEYDKYLKWYSETTSLGISEQKHLQAQLEYVAIEAKYEEKEAMKKKKQAKNIIF